MKKILSLILALVTCFTAFAFVGCTPAEQNPTSNEIVIADFEKFEPDFQLIRLMNRFGAVSVNEDAQYVKSGKYSAKLQPTGSYSQNAKPFMYFPLTSERFNYNYSDMTTYDYVQMWVYNAQDTNKNMEIGVVGQINSVDSVEKATDTIVDLKPGWNRVIYFPNYDMIGLAGDPNNIPGLFLGFDHTHTRDIEEAPVFYIDDVIIKKAATPHEVKDVIQLDPGEIINFEKDYQRYVITLDVANEKCTPDYGIVNSSEVGIQATSGNSMLKLVTKPGDVFHASWPMFVIPQKVVRESGYMNIPEEDWDKYQICFDVYAETASLDFYPEFFASGGRNRKAYKIIAEKGKWVTFRLTLSEMVTSHVIDPGYIRMAWGEYVTGGEMTFYFDNFRYERIAD